MLISSLRVVRVISTSFLVTLGYFSLPTQAQVVSDQTLDSQVNRVDNNNLVITGGKEAEQNLFHSFSDFSVPSNSTVHFANGGNIENIFSRVTGGSISNIDGLIKANGSASLFLLNPAGIIFGPDAQLDIGGSFIATTAEAIVFPEGVFSAVDTNSPPILTVNIPIGLQYGKSPGAIIAEGELRDNPTEEDPEGKIESLRVQTPDHTFALVGGEVVLKGTNIAAERGSVEIGSVASEEFVALTKNNQVWDFSYDRVNKFSQIELQTSSIFSGDGGSIQIQGKDIIITETVIINPTFGDINGGNVDLIATNSILLDASFIFTTVGDPITIRNIDEQIRGDGGNIFLKGNSILLSNVSRISAETFSQGDGGEITIEAKELMQLSGQLEVGELVLSSSITTNTEGEGAGGKITLTANSLILEDEGIIESRASPVLVGEDGDGGDINITTDTLVLFDRSSISANAEEGNKGNGGNIQINTQGLFVASGIDQQITADADVGIDGTVEINTPDVDSQVDTKVVERSPLVVENLIYTGCDLGKDYISNKFIYIGRGGLPLNPMQEIATEDLMVDLGKLEVSKTQNKINQSIPSLQDKSHQEIREVTGWIVNQKGNIEMISPTTKVADSSICLLQPGDTIDID